MDIETDVPPRLSLAPRSLLAAMWLQFALALRSAKEFRECKFCLRLFEISTEQTGFRSHREFCSDTCKTKDYRRRKQTAVKLARKGLPVSEIADRIETDKSTIRSWLSMSTGAKPGKGRL